jgi:uncharacterized damage-inducible protein DinB
MSQPTVEEFRGSWNFIRGMTHQFIETVPPQHWEYAPHASVSPLCKQFRHLVWVSGLYNDALTNLQTDLSRKKQGYSGSLDKPELAQALKEKDAELGRILDRLKTQDLESYRVDHFGTFMTFNEFTHVLIQHESLHQGMWALYARTAGFATPKGWKDNWEL